LGGGGEGAGSEGENKQGVFHGSRRVKMIGLKGSERVCSKGGRQPSGLKLKVAEA
jgi:hypothetical protein